MSNFDYVNKVQDSAGTFTDSLPFVQVKTMVKKVFVKRGGKDGAGEASQVESAYHNVVDVPYQSGSDYVIDFADDPDQLEVQLVDSTGEETADLQLVEVLEEYEQCDIDFLQPDVLLTEKEVEVAAYATLSATGNSSASAPAVVLESTLCPLECGTTIKSENHLRGHLKDKHAIQMQKQIEQFPNMGSFLCWKEARERESSRRYVIRESRNNWRRFSCSRSGQPTGTDQPQRWRRTGNFCPAYIRTKTQADGAVKARFSLFHTCKQPDNSPLPSDRELAKASRQVSLLERALLEARPRRHRQYRRRLAGRVAPAERSPAAGTGTGTETQPGREAESRAEPEPELEPESEPGPEPELGPELEPEKGQKQTGPCEEPVTTDAGLKPPENSERVRKILLGPSGAPAKRILGVGRREVTAGSGLEDVRARVKTNLLRLHVRLEHASEAEAAQMLADTNALLERHTRIRRRGRTGTLYWRRRRGQLSADHPYGHPEQAQQAQQGQQTLLAERTECSPAAERGTAASGRDSLLTEDVERMERAATLVDDVTVVDVSCVDGVDDVDAGWTRELVQVVPVDSVES